MESRGATTSRAGRPSGKRNKQAGSYGNLGSRAVDDGKISQQSYLIVTNNQNQTKQKEELFAQQKLHEEYLAWKKESG